MGINSSITKKIVQEKTGPTSPSGLAGRRERAPALPGEYPGKNPLTRSAETVIIIAAYHHYVREENG